VKAVSVFVSSDHDHMIKTIQVKLTKSLIYFSFQSCVISKPGGLDLSRRDLDRDLDLDAQKVSVSTVKKISTVFKS
jgi:hypothetical protein